jgi:hypothetical protein
MTGQSQAATIESHHPDRRLAPGASDAQERLLWMLNGTAMTQMIHAAVELNLFDLLDDRAMTCAELAERTGTHLASIRRLIRALASLGVLESVADERFCPTAVGKYLRAGASGSLRAVARHAGDPTMQRAWGGLLHTLRTGQTAFDASFGMDYGTYLAQNPAAAQIFHERSRAGAARIVSALLAAYDFSSFNRIVDVGGGYGHLIAGILQSYSQPRGLVFDLPSAFDGARDLLTSAGVADRCEVVSGDVFDGVPAGGDLYVLKSMLHGWDDACCIDLLQNCRRAMREDGVLLAVERHLPDAEPPSPYPAIVDMTLLVLGTGRERTTAQYRSLLQAAGFRLNRVVKTETEFVLFEAVPS